MGDKPKRLISIICLIALVLGLLPAGALAAGGGYGVSEFAFYYLYDSNLPTHPESPGKGPEFYGPSGNDVPFRMASVDIDELLELYPAGAADWESRKVISAVTCGLGMDNNAEWWSGVVQCMDAESREYFTSDSFGKLFQGYVLKGGLLGAYPNHLDGVIIVPPPLYLVELNDSYGGSFIATLSSEAPHTAQQVQAEIESYLKTAYGAQQIEWAGNYGVFRGAELQHIFRHHALRRLERRGAGARHRQGRVSGGRRRAPAARRGGEGQRQRRARVHRHRQKQRRPGGGRRRQRRQAPGRRHDKRRERTHGRAGLRHRRARPRR